MSNVLSMDLSSSLLLFIKEGWGHEPQHGGALLVEQEKVFPGVGLHELLGH